MRNIVFYDTKNRTFLGEEKKILLFDLEVSQ